MSIILYEMAGSPPCGAVLMTVDHLKIDLKRIELDWKKLEHLEPQFVKMNPQHCVPTIDDNGFILWESRAIQTYLANKYAPDNSIYPKDPQARAAVDRMLYFDIGTLFKAEDEHLYPIMHEGKPEDPVKLEAFKKALILFEEYLSKTKYAAADHITLADFSLFAILTYAEAVDFSYAEYPKISAWMQKMKSEVPNNKEINEKSVNEVKKWLEIARSIREGSTPDTSQL